MLYKEGLKGLFFSSFNAGVFMMLAMHLFACEFGWFSQKFIYFGIFILPLIIVIYYTIKIMMKLRDKNPGNLILCLVFCPHLMLIPTIILWLIYAKQLAECFLGKI